MRSYLHAEKGGVLVHALILTMIVMTGIVLASQLVAALWQEQGLYFKEKEAYYLAESGIEYAKAMLAENPHWRPQNPVSYGGGEFTIVLSDGAITAYGTYGGLTRRVSWRPGEGIRDVLGPIKRALHSEKDINLSKGGNLNVSGDGYINGDLTVHKEAEAYFYDLYLTGKLRIKKGGIFRISGKPYQGSREEPMPKPSWEELREQAAQVLEPTAFLNGKYDLGAGNLVVVDGNLDLSDLEITGWGTIAVNGDLRLHGGIRASPGPVTLIVTQNCYLFGNTVDSLLYVYGSVHSFEHWGPNRINGALWAEEIDCAGSDLTVIYDERLKSGVLWRSYRGNGIWSSN